MNFMQAGKKERRFPGQRIALVIYEKGVLVIELCKRRMWWWWWGGGAERGWGEYYIS